MQTKPPSRLVDGSLALKARQRANSTGAPKAGSKGKKIALIVTVFLLLAAGGVGSVWAWNYMASASRIARMKELREKEQDPSLSAADRKALRDERHQLGEQMSESERQKLRGGDEGPGRWMRQEEDRMKKFFALSPAQQVEQLNKDIDRMVAEAAKRSSNAAKSGTPGNTANNAANSGGNSAAGADKGGDRGPGGPRGAMTDAQKQARRDSFLSSHPPEQRTQWTQNMQLGRMYHNMMQNQAAQRGITLPQQGFGGRRGS